MKKCDKIHYWILTILRIAIGWHFFYEGIIKLLNPDWSAAGYLMNSAGFLSGFFRTLAENSIILAGVDALNMWGLLLIGLALFIGYNTHIASVAGILLLSLYYLAYPPFGAGLYVAGQEGSYFIINKVLIEMLALFALAFTFPANMYGIDRLLFLRGKDWLKTAPATIGDGETEKLQKKDGLSRREAIKNLAAVPALGILAGAGIRVGSGVDGVSSATNVTVESAILNDLKKKIPSGKIGDLELSRVFMGGNVIKGWAHARDLLYVNKLMAAYHTEQKKFENFRIAEAAGINSIMVNRSNSLVINKYNKQFGGKIKQLMYIYQESEKLGGGFKQQVDAAIDSGASTMFICGASTDYMVLREQYDYIHNALEYIRENGFQAGLAGHSINALIRCKDYGIDPDYYLKSFHHDNYWSATPKKHRVDFTVDGEKSLDHNKFHDNIFCLYPEKTIEFFQSIDKPFIAFKIFAAGAIPPESAFKWAFDNGADFICAGMLDFQIIEDINYANNALDNLQSRIRPFYG